MKNGKTKNKLTWTKAGFSFIEVILAVFVVSAGMVGVLGLMSKTLSGSMDSRDQIIAVFLAQEGVELVQNLRDNNWAQEKNAFGDATDSTFPAANVTDCRIDYNDGSLFCGLSYVLNSNGGFYDHDGGTATKFSRRIEVDYSNGGKTTADNFVTITSAVTWNNTIPPAAPTNANCNTSAKCAFTTLVLTRWGWN